MECYECDSKYTDTKSGKSHVISTHAAPRQASSNRYYSWADHRRDESIKYL